MAALNWVDTALKQLEEMVFSAWQKHSTKKFPHGKRRLDRDNANKKEVVLLKDLYNLIPFYSTIF